jgi:hypothetical protein
MHFISLIFHERNTSFKSFDEMQELILFSWTTLSIHSISGGTIKEGTIDM